MLPSDLQFSAHHYALLDCAAHAGAYLELCGSHANIGWRSIFDETEDASLIAASPILIPMEPAALDRRLIDTLLQYERDAPSISWIKSPFGTATLLAMLSSRYQCRIDGDVDVVLRFWDPRILLGLPSALDDEQRRHFFFPVLEWTVWDARRKQYYTITPPPGAMPVPRYAKAPINLSRDQRESLMYFDRETIYEAIMDDWSRHCHEAVRHISRGMQREIAIAGVSRAREHGVQTASEQILFARLMMTVSPSFDDHPAIRRALSDPNAPDGRRLQHAIDSLPDQVWIEASERRRYDAFFEMTVTHP